MSALLRHAQFIRHANSSITLPRRLSVVYNTNINGDLGILYKLHAIICFHLYLTFSSSSSSSVTRLFTRILSLVLFTPSPLLAGLQRGHQESLSEIQPHLPPRQTLHQSRVYRQIKTALRTHPHSVWWLNWIEVALPLLKLISYSFLLYKTTLLLIDFNYTF